MLQCDGLITSLVSCLLLGDRHSSRRAQAGAAELVEAAVGTLHELSLFAPWADAMRLHTDVLTAMRELLQAGTKKAKESARAALFELDEEVRAAAVAGSKSREQQSTSTPPPHVMASYNWDHQDVILRVVASLQDRGYLVWVDTEQMKGATVDTMALAVEGSALVLIGVSRAYKESSNCRMEAQYALQKKKPLVPLMLTQGYEADGWLGLMLGTSLWYAMYGETLASGSAFEDRMAALCREIGARGRADAVVAAAPAPALMAAFEPEPEGCASLREELQALRVRDLVRRAREADIDEDKILDAQDESEPRSALLELLVADRMREFDTDAVAVRIELEGLRMRDLVARAKAVGVDDEAVLDAQDSDSPKDAIVQLLLANGS